MQIELILLWVVISLVLICQIVLYRKVNRINNVLLDLQIDISLYEKMKKELKKQKEENKIIKVGKWIK